MNLDRVYARTCAIYRLLKGGHINKATAQEMAARRIRHTHRPPGWLDNTIEIWLRGPLRGQR